MCMWAYDFITTTISNKWSDHMQNNAIINDYFQLPIIKLTTSIIYLLKR